MLYQVDGDETDLWMMMVMWDKSRRSVVAASADSGARLRDASDSCLGDDAALLPNL